MHQRTRTLLGGAPALLAAWLWTPAAAGAQAPAADVLDRASARYDEVHALCADFRQVMDIPLLGEQKKSEGRLCQRRPHFFVMDFTRPEGDLVVADGRYLWIYYPSTDEKQVMRAPLSEAGGSFDFHREFLEDPSGKYASAYQGEEAVDGAVTDVVRLTPLRPSAYEDARVWIDRETGLIKQVRIREENGSTRTVTLANLVVDPELDDGLFRFQPPPGAQVIER